MSLCRDFLTARRVVARRAGEPTDAGLGVLDNASSGSHRYFVVEGKQGGIVWEGSACCRYCARVEAIGALAKAAEPAAPAPETANLVHRHGGKITHVYSVGHETYKGVADWFYFGRVEWSDGSVSESTRIAPTALCYDDSAASQARVRDLGAQLMTYLNEAGDWHDMKHKRDGRAYSWTPKKPADSKAVTP